MKMFGLVEKIRKVHILIMKEQFRFSFLRQKMFGKGRLECFEFFNVNR